MCEQKDKVSVDENMTKEFPDCATCTFNVYCKRQAPNCPIIWLIDHIGKLKEKVNV